MKWKLGNSKQIIVSVVLLGIVGFATQLKPVSNIHLAVTLLLAIMHGYAAYAWSKGGTLANKVNPSKAYVISFAINAIVSIAMSWWFSGLVWIYNLCIYIAIQKPKEMKEIQDEN